MDNADALESTDLLDDDLPTDVCRVGLELKFAVPEAKAHELVAALSAMLEPATICPPLGLFRIDGTHSSATSTA
jgi:hypothetical protein